MTQQVITLTEENPSLVTQQIKEAICNAIIMGQVFHDSVIGLPEETQHNMKELVLDFQRKLVPLLPTQTQQWVMKELQKDKLKILPIALKNYVKAGEGSHEMIYSETNHLLSYLTDNKKRAKKLDSEKYALLFKFIKQEAEADLTKGTPALGVSNGSIVFQLVQPTSGKKEVANDD